MLEPFQPSAGAPVAVSALPRWLSVSRLWAHRPSLPDYFRDMLTHDPCTHPELLVRVI